MSEYRTAEPLDSLMEKAWLTIHDEIAVPGVVYEWAEGSFRTGFMTALAMVGVDRRKHRGRITASAIAEAVARLER